MIIMYIRDGRLHMNLCNLTKLMSSRHPPSTNLDTNFLIGQCHPTVTWSLNLVSIKLQSEIWPRTCSVNLGAVV